MNADRMVYLYLAWFMLCYLSVLGREALNNGWLIKYGEGKRQLVRKICSGFFIFSFVGVTIS